MSFQYDSERIEPREPERLTIDERYEVLKAFTVNDLLEYVSEQTYNEIQEELIDIIISNNLDTENL